MDNKILAGFYAILVLFCFGIGGMWFIDRYFQDPHVFINDVMPFVMFFFGYMFYKTANKLNSKK